MWDKLTKVFLIFLLLVSIFLRFYKLGSVPQGLNIDEASYGYDAYSLLKTGKDQWGRSWPKVFYSFGDYKPPGLTYLIYSILHFLPLSTLAVRLPSALAGFGILILTFKIIKLIYTKKISRNIILLLIIILATSPWFFGISRLFFEVNVGLFFIVWQFYLIFKNIHPRLHRLSFKSLIELGVISGIPGYLQSSLRYLALANLLTYLAILWHKNKSQFTSQWRLAIIPLIIALTIQLPIFSQWFGKAGLIRLQQESSKRLEAISLTVNHNRNLCWLNSGHNNALTKTCYLLWNKPFNRLEGIIKTAVDTISLPKLFFHNVDTYIIPSNYGAYVWPLILFFILGIYHLFKLSKSRNLLILFSLIINLGLTSLVGELSVHRNVVTYYLIFLIMIIGLEHLILIIKQNNISNLFIIGFLSLSILLNFRYLSYYFFIFQASNNAYNSKQVMTYLNRANSNYKYFYDDFYFIGPMLYAFHSAIDPDFYQTQTVWSHPNQYGNTIPIQVGKYQTKHLTMEEIVCHKLEGLWITKPDSSLPNRSQLISFKNKGNLPEVAIYDLDIIKQNQNYQCPDSTTIHSN